MWYIGYSLRMSTGMIPVLAILVVLSMLPEAKAVGTPYNCNAYMDLIITLDSSESLLEGDPRGQPFHNWRLLKNFTKDIISDLQVPQGHTQVGMLAYSDAVNHVFNLGDYTDRSGHANPVENMHQIIDDMDFIGGTTNTARAINIAQQLRTQTAGERNYRRVIMVLTDGLSNRPRDTVDEARESRADGTEIFALGVGEYVDASELRNIASRDDNVIHVASFDHLTYMRDLVVHRLCRLPDPVPPVTVSPDRCDSDIRLDIAFLIDSSGSITDKNPDNFTDNYQLLKDFVKSLVNLVEIGPQQNQVGAVIFSEYSELLFRMNEYTSQESIGFAIDEATHLRSHTNIASALRMAREDIFQPEFGDRADIQNVIILITDGLSTREANLTAIEAELAKQAAITIFVIGITNEVDEEELIAVASTPTQEHLYQVEAIGSLDSIVSALIRHVCARDATTSAADPSTTTIETSTDENEIPRNTVQTKKKNKKSSATARIATLSSLFIMWCLTLVCSLRDFI